MPDSPSQKALFIDGPKTRAIFDGAFRAEISDVCAAVDKGLKVVDCAWGQVNSLPKRQKRIDYYCLAIACNILNTIVGAVEMLRLGYYAGTHSMLRGALEGLCTLILIRTDKNIYERYVAGEYSVHKSVQQISKHPKLKPLKKLHEWYHRFAHPTIHAVENNFASYTLNKPVGGAFCQERAKDYRKHLENLQAIAETVYTLLCAQYPAAKHHQVKGLR